MKIFLLYLLIFSFFLISYPLKGQLFCDPDSWYYIAIFSHYIEVIKALFNGNTLYSYMYPEISPYSNGESSFGMFLLYLPEYLVSKNEIWSYYCFTCLILAINSFSIYLLSSFYLENVGARILAGFFFSFNNFIFSNIGFQSTIFFGCAALGIYYLKAAIAENSHKKAFFFFLFSSVQVFCSAYVFVFQQLFAGMIIGANFIKTKQLLRANFTRLFPGLLTLWASIILFCFLFFVPSSKSGYYNFVQDDYLLKFLSINGFDLARGGFLGKAIFNTDEPLKWIIDWRSLSLGVTGFTFLLFGLFAAHLNSKRELLLVLCLSFCIGLGPYIEILSWKIELPYGYLWNKFDVLKFIRFPYRIYMITLVPLAILMAHGFDRLIKFKILTSFKPIYLLLITLYLIENAPSFSIKGSRISNFISESKQYLNFSIQLTGENILYMPAYNIIKPNSNDNSYMVIISECVYMYLQTKQENNVINGCSGFYSPQRMRLNDIIDKFNKTGDSASSIDSLDFTYLIFYKGNPFHYIDYDFRIKDLLADEHLQVVYDDSLQIAFKKVK